MKNLLLNLLIIFLLSCNESGKNYLPNSIGKIDEVLVLMNENNWNGEPGEAFKEKFAAAYLVLPQAEPIFSLRPKIYKQFNRLMQKYRNIIIVSTLDEEDEIAELMKNTLGKENVEKVKQGSTTFFSAKKNVWAEPQTVILIFAPDKNELISRIKNRGEEIVNLLHSSEEKIVHEKLFAYGKNDAVMKLLNEKFNINFPIPSDYQLAVDSDNFIWLRKETDDLSSNIMIFVQPYSDSLQIQNCWNWRDAIGKKFISTQTANSFMMTDTMIPFFQKRNSLQVVETRGLWRMANDFMGGPFINYCILDEKNKRVIMLDGFVYAPKLKKREQIRKLEVLFSLMKEK